MHPSSGACPDDRHAIRVSALEAVAGRGSAVPATDAARNFSDLLDAVEHRHEHYTVVRRGRVVAQISPMVGGRGADLKALLRGKGPGH
jgi:prevent-host-death family protein